MNPSTNPPIHCCTLIISLLSICAAAQDAVTPGEFIIDPPTIENLGFRWYVDGDDNRNASVSVSYRRRGDQQWRAGHPMLRVKNEVVNQAFEPYRTGNLFAGSVMFLRPGTPYEVRFEMRDTDGGAPVPKVIAVATRAEPVAFDRGRTIQVRNYGELLAAYDSAQPGDIILLRAGVYSVPSTWTLAKSGVPGKPIVFRGAGGEAVIEGAGLTVDLLNVMNAAHLMFEDLTFRNANHAILAGRKGGPGAPYLTVRRCRIHNVVYGITTSSENSVGWYIVDNELVGVNQSWYPRPENYMAPGHTGLNIYGQGNVAAYNRITRFSDGIAPANVGSPQSDIRKHAVNIDIYNNEVSWAQDDCIETDYGAHNFRVYRNRCFNAHTGISSQPFYGGPVYIVRNEVYGVTALTLKLHNYCAGLEVYHNTVASARSGFQSFDRWQNGHFRNNLILGGTGYAMVTGSLTPYSTLDYNGYRRNNTTGPLIRWFDGAKRVDYASLEDFHTGTGHERHGILVDYASFVHAQAPIEGVSAGAARYDLRLRPGAAPVDAGLRMPGINDDLNGLAPDLGCYEQGAPPVHYGPRPRQRP
jgi:hypothetical protein